MGKPFGLNEAQRVAVEHIDGPLLVVAGAGTGKTRVIVERMQHLINSGVDPRNILALTFTEKAAGEMRDRIADTSLGTSIETTIATYNGFGNDLLHDYGSEWGLGTLRLLGETGQLVFLREHLDQLELDYFAPIARPDGQLDKLAQYVSLLKQQLVEPKAYETYAAQLPESDAAERIEKQKQQEVARFYATYLRICREQQVIDYDDQLYLTIELLRARPNILHILRDRYRYILVDEFQDTNPMQSALVDLLASVHQNIMVVGDDDQSIYGWRGATLANILDFSTRYPNTENITLIENYRSSQPILDASYRLIQHNNPDRLEVMNKLDKKLHAQIQLGTEPQAKHFFSLEAELTWVVDDITRRIQRGQSPSSIAILARRRQVVEQAHESLELHDIPHAVAGLSSNMYAQPVVKQLIEALKAVSDPFDDLALFHTLSGPLFTQPQHILSEVAAIARRDHERLSAVIRASTEPTLIAALETVETWRETSSDVSVGTLAYTMITDSGWKEQLYRTSTDNPELSTQMIALSKFFVTLKEFEKIASVASVQNYVQNLSALQAGGSDFEDASLEISDSLVNVLSVHRSKGLEWDTVYIIDCTEGSFPLMKRGGNLEVPAALKASRSLADEHMAEERRLMYVAATRARNELILTYANRHGNGAPRRPSRFLKELLEHDASELEVTQEQAKLELFAPKRQTEIVQLPTSMSANGTITLSVSQIACWLDCPQNFYYRYVLGMPIPDDPSRQYGTAMHGAIEKIFEGRRSHNVPSEQEITEFILSSLPQSGYATAGTKTRAHAQAKTSAKILYERFVNEPLPSKIEQSFGVRATDLPLKIVGRIDAVYETEKGIEIRDYKTSASVTTPEKAKTRATGSKQLTLYAYAWRIMHDEMPALLTLDFIETGQIGSVRKQPKSLETLHGKLEQLVTQLHAGEYPLGKTHEYCSHPQ